MKVEKLTGTEFDKLILYAAKFLLDDKEKIDALNVFPVPDGDTGTNLSMTIVAAAQECLKTQSSSVAAKAEAAAKGSLLGARGNSGVIFSQLLRGFAKGLVGKDEASAEDLIRALEEASNTAYKAVVRPIEGTMLTVARETASNAKQAPEKEDLVAFARFVLDAAYESLEGTREKLPALQEAGVVDAGGQGLVSAAEGVLYALENWAHAPSISIDELLAEQRNGSTTEVVKGGIQEQASIEFRYCTEFLLLGEDLNQEQIKKTLMPRGDSLLVVGDSQTLKIHVHTNHPGLVLEECLRWGALAEVQINNMELQNKAAAAARTPKENKPIGVVSVVIGEGLSSIFSSLGVDWTVEGGQTMNPSTEDLVRAVEEVPAEKVIILPNNGNVIFTAQQVKHLTKKPVEVVSSRSIPQGLAAMLAYDPNGELEDNQTAMSEAASQVRTGEVTFAVRSSRVDDLEINQGDYIGLADGKIVTTGPIQLDVGLELIKAMDPQEDDIITIFYGQEVDEGQGCQFKERVEEIFPQCDVELHYGGQPLYYYLISIE
ncbi:MAG: DAK2 domain-containing protein [Limnochordia bacterium]